MSHRRAREARVFNRADRDANIDHLKGAGLPIKRRHASSRPRPRRARPRRGAGRGRERAHAAVPLLRGAVRGHGAEHDAAHGVRRVDGLRRHGGAPELRAADPGEGQVRRRALEQLPRGRRRGERPAVRGAQVPDLRARAGGAARRGRRALARGERLHPGPELREHGGLPRRRHPLRHAPPEGARRRERPLPGRRPAARAEPRRRGLRGGVAALRSSARARRRRPSASCPSCCASSARTGSCSLALSS